MRQRESQPQINDRSRRLVEHKRLVNATEGHVHNRLHQQALSKQRQRAESSKNASRKAFDLSRHSSPDVGQPRELVNYGERLYQKGIKRKEEQERLLQDVRALKEQQELQCPFQP